MRNPGDEHADAILASLSAYAVPGNGAANGNPAFLGGGGLSIGEQVPNDSHHRLLRHPSPLPPRTRARPAVGIVYDRRPTAAARHKSDLREGEMFVVPKGVRHNPVAEQECHILLIERKSTLHTGDVVTDKTRSISEQLRPV